MESVLVAGYADDFAVLGENPEVVNGVRDRIKGVLKQQFKLPVHDLQVASLDESFIGLEL